MPDPKFAHSLKWQPMQTQHVLGKALRVDSLSLVHEIASRRESFVGCIARGWREAECVKWHATYLRHHTSAKSWAKGLPRRPQDLRSFQGMEGASTSKDRKAPGCSRNWWYNWGRLWSTWWWLSVEPPLRQELRAHESMNCILYLYEFYKDYGDCSRWSKAVTVRKCWFYENIHPMIWRFSLMCTPTLLTLTQRSKEFIFIKSHNLKLIHI